MSMAILSAVIQLGGNNVDGDGSSDIYIYKWWLTRS